MTGGPLHRVAIVVAVFIAPLAGCTVRHLTANDAHHISPGELRSIIATEPDVLVVDVRHEPHSRIAGAINVPLQKIDRSHDRLRDADPVVVYADADAESLTLAAAERILDCFSRAVEGTDFSFWGKGSDGEYPPPVRGPVAYYNVKNVMILDGGVEAWIQDGGAMEPR